MLNAKKILTFVNIVQNFQLHMSKTLLKTNPNPWTPFWKPSHFSNPKNQTQHKPQPPSQIEGSSRKSKQPWGSSKHQREPSSSMVAVNGVATPTSKNKKKPTNKHKHNNQQTKKPSVLTVWNQNSPYPPSSWKLTPTKSTHSHHNHYQNPHPSTTMATIHKKPQATSEREGMSGF